MVQEFTIRQAERRDVPLLLEFIRGIAKYEKMEDEVVATVETLEAEMFDHHKAEAVFAVVDGKEVGLRCISLISQRSSAIRVCIWRICLCGLSIEGKVMARRCCCIWLRKHERSIAEGWSGAVSIGTNPALTSISRSEPFL